MILTKTSFAQQNKISFYNMAETLTTCVNVEWNNMPENLDREEKNKCIAHAIQ